MKKAFYIRLLICCLCCMLLAPAVASAPGPQLAFGGQMLCIDTVRINPDQIVNESPDQNTFLYIRMRVDEGTVGLADIVENISSFVLKDDQGGRYDALAYMPYTMAFNRRNGVFTTHGVQGKFDLFFIVPAGTNAKTLEMYVGNESIAFADLDASCFSEE